MAKYFHISTGLRGGYMPDSAYVAKCDTRRDLKALIESEATSVAAGETPVQGLSKRAVASFAALLWREAQKPRPAFLPYALAWQYRGQVASYPYGIFASVASRTDYLEHEREAGE